MADLQPEPASLVPAGAAPSIAVAAGPGAVSRELGEDAAWGQLPPGPPPVPPGPARRPVHAREPAPAVRVFNPWLYHGEGTGCPAALQRQTEGALGRTLAAGAGAPAALAAQLTPTDRARKFRKYSLASPLYRKYSLICTPS